jgi:hypothetical protein
LRRRAIGAHAIFHGDEAGFIPAERRVNQAVLFAHPAVDDGEIFFFHGAAFEDFSEFAGDSGIFCEEDHAAGFAVEAVDEMRPGKAGSRSRGGFQMQPRAADQAGQISILGRVADESRRFVDDQQFIVFVDDVKKFFHNLSLNQAGVSSTAVKEKWNRWLPVLFVALFAGSRIPGLLPSNFSAAYAFAFCAGVYFRGATAWWLPLGAMLATDLALDFFYYHSTFAGFCLNLPPNYLIYAAIIWLGRRLGARANFFKLLGGSLLGAIIFYLVTNTLSWLEIPDYAKTVAGWIQALGTGLPGYPPTWEFFRNTLLSTGIFTALFAGAAKLTASAESPAEKKAGARDEESETEEKPEEAKA